MLKKWSFLGWNLFEVVWLTVFSAVGIYLSVMWKSDLFGLSVFMSGILCVVLTAKGSLWSYLFGVYNSIGYGIIAFGNKLFGEFGLNILFFVPMNILGFYLWRKKMNEKSVKMRGMSKKITLLTILVCTIVTLLMGFGLSHIKGQNNPYIDAATVVISVFATVLTVWRYKEQWLLYIILNVLTVVLWYIRMINGSPEAPLMIVMWSSFLVNAVYGYINWSKGEKKEKIEDVVLEYGK